MLNTTETIKKQLNQSPCMVTSNLQPVAGLLELGIDVLLSVNMLVTQEEENCRFGSQG